MAVNFILSAPLSTRFIGSTQQILYIQWINHLLCAHHCKDTWGVKEIRRATCSRTKTIIPLLQSITYRTQNWKKKNAIWWIFSTSEEEYKYSFWNFYFPLNVFTVHHTFQWELFNKCVVTLFKSWLLIACSFHGISEIANQIVFQSSFSMQYPESHLSL